MVDYVKEMVNEFPEELSKIKSAYPANGHLFDTDKGTKLDDLRAVGEHLQASCLD